MVIKYMNVSSLEFTTSILKAIAWYKTGVQVVLFINGIPKCDIRLIPGSAPSKDAMVCLMSDYDAGAIMFYDGMPYINLPIGSDKPVLVGMESLFIDECLDPIGNGDPVVFTSPGESKGFSYFSAFGYASIDGNRLYILNHDGKPLRDPYTGKIVCYERDGEPCHGLSLTNDIRFYG